MTLLSNGNLIFGKTADNDTSAGIRFQSNGSGSFVRDNNVALNVNRLTGDGNLVEFRKDSNLKGSVAYFGNEIQIGQGNVNIQFSSATNAIVPANSNGTANNAAVDLGLTAAKFKDAHFSGTVNAATGLTTAANQRVQSSSGMLFLNGPSALTFEVGAGSEKMRLTSTGLGIGTQVPASLLNVFTDTGRDFRVDHGTANRTILSTDRGMIIKAGGGYSLDLDTNSSSGTLRFFANGSESARLTSGGDFLVGTSAVADTDNAITLRNDGRATFASNVSSTTIEVIRHSSGTAMEFVNTGGSPIVGSITVTGSATAYNTSSDARLKENIEDADDSGTAIDSLLVRQFDWKSDGKHVDYGMIAQEVIHTCPNAVSVPQEDGEMMGIDYSKMVPLLLKEIQELRKRVKKLEE